jgi:hypothetical protein
VFIPYQAIDWAAVLTTGVWITGFAVITAAAGYFLFLADGRPKPFFSSMIRGSGRKFTLLGFILIGTGLLFSLGNRDEPISAGKFLFVPAKIDPPASSAVLGLADGTPVPLQDLSRSRNFRIRRDILWMWADGYVDTPWLRLNPGRYRAEIETYGTAQEGGFPRFLTAWLGIEGKSLELRFPFRDFETTADARVYAYSFVVDRQTVGKVRFEAFSMMTSDRNVTRSLWIKRIVIRREAS